jgi:23S rRNA (uracil1939-C5)-methyltransferase
VTGDAASDLVIERLGLRGDGLAGGVRVPFALPGERVRVPFALPGERVRGPIADGLMVEPEIVVAAPERVAPPCRHFGACGGCQLQHAHPVWLAEWKREVIVEALAALGLAAGEIRPMLTSPPRSRRRVVLAGRRTRRTVLLGFHGRRSGTLVDIAECHVADPAILAAKPALAGLVALGAARSREVRLVVTAGPAGLDVDLRDGKPLDAGLRAALAEAARGADLARFSWDGETVALRRPPFQAMGAARVVPPPGAFLQATPQGEAALVAAVGRGLLQPGQLRPRRPGAGRRRLPARLGAAGRPVPLVHPWSSPPRSAASSAISS